MGIYLRDLDGGFSTVPLVRTPRLTIRCEYPDKPLEAPRRRPSGSPIDCRYQLHLWANGGRRVSNGSILGARTLKQPLGELLPLAQALHVAR